MAKGVITPQETRNEIIAKIRNEGMTVAEAARQYNIGPKAIYSWMRDGVVNSSTFKEGKRTTLQFTG
jgi:transposase-like protein